MKVLVTGGTNGMGKGVAKALAGIDGQAHEVILLSRSAALCEATVNEIERETLNRKTSYVVCDLARLGDVRKAVAEIRSRHESLDGVFINAGLGYAARRVETVDGMNPHFQVNYLSQFMLMLNLLDLLNRSETGGRVIFNVTHGGKMSWDDLQMERSWSYARGIHQAMVAKRMFLLTLHDLHRRMTGSKLSFIGFEIPKTVWSNQVNIIPAPMRIMATMMKALGGFISIERCGAIMAPLFAEGQGESLNRSGKMITWKKGAFIDLQEDAAVLNTDSRDRLWETSLGLCRDEATNRVAGSLHDPLSGPG